MSDTLQHAIIDVVARMPCTVGRTKLSRAVARATRWRDDATATPLEAALLEHLAQHPKTTAALALSTIDAAIVKGLCATTATVRPTLHVTVAGIRLLDAGARAASGSVGRESA